MYRCVAATLEGFVQQIATAYVPHGYWFYVQGLIPERKRAETVDEKLIGRYGVAMSKWARARHKRAGLASIQYIRFERIFVIMVTQGQHPFFEEEHGAIRDVAQDADPDWGLQHQRAARSGRQAACARSH